MSWSPCPDPVPGDRVSADAIEMLIIPRAVDLGEMQVRRALPSAKRQMVGPFIFFDQMGPTQFLTDQGIDVRPHPHINLAAAADRGGYSTGFSLLPSARAVRPIGVIVRRHCLP
jgi:hypothetical protein